MKHKVILYAVLTAFFALCSLTVRAAYPRLYVVGSFQPKEWDLPSAVTADANADGVYTVNLTFANAGSFKMSFSGNSDWGQFDRMSIGIDTDSDWTPGIYEMVSRIDNSHLDRGQWVITVYYNESMIALSRPGEEVPTPGDLVRPGKQPSGTLPVLYINVYGEDGKLDNEVIDYNLGHKNYFSGKYWLDLNGCEWLAELGAESLGSEAKPLDLQIKARGNYTRTGFSKKPFKLKLDKKQSMLGLSKSKHFALMAHADDTYGFLRNFTGFELGKRIGLPWTPSQQPVEVVINGDYRGLYFLTESIRIDSDRVDIREGADNETEKEYISGGYIVELDNYDEDESSQIRMAERSCVDGHYLDALRITFDTPEVYSDLQRRFITDQFSAMNQAVGTCDDNLWAYMDLDDAARYYLVKEIVSDTEAYHGSTYLFRDHGNGKKWHFSPLWDFGNAFNGSTGAYLYDNDPYGNTWIPSMRTNAKFNDKVRQTWLWFMSNRFTGIEDEMDQYISHIETAARFDQLRWTDHLIPQPSVSCNDLRQRLSAAKNHLHEKIGWLRFQFGDYTGATFTEPARDTTPAAALPDYAASGVENVAIDPEGTMSKVWYNLQGQPVARPVRGNIYVTPDGLIRY